MGQEISGSHFYKQDFRYFERRLEEETAVLRAWFEQARFSDTPPVGGFELEAWLVDAQCQAAPINTDFLDRANSPLVTPELSRFNVELNGTPQRLEGQALSLMAGELDDTVEQCQQVARSLDATMIMTGILPTVTDKQLTLKNISEMERYRALNEQVLRLRKGSPLLLDIQGIERLRSIHLDVMTEAAATSFQIHIQAPFSMAARLYNASVALSAPLVAVSANSPYFFGRDLWDETRIPLFEQSVEVGGQQVTEGPALRRVSFGSGYVKASLMECFEENLASFPVLLPACFDEPEDYLLHLRLHNGTIWRWNRPLIGFNDNGSPHLRIEQRVVPSGPTVADSVANSAFFYGLVWELARREEPVEQLLPFATARENFYQCARQGLRASVAWGGGQKGPVQTLISEQLLGMARRGLERLDIAGGDIDQYLGIIEARVRTTRNGAGWQRDFVTRHGADMQALTEAYRERQASGIPVHEWPL